MHTCIKVNVVAMLCSTCTLYVSVLPRDFLQAGSDGLLTAHFNFSYRA